MQSKVRPMRILMALLLCAMPAYADLVTRPTKTCNKTNYVEEVADGCTKIKASELDADFQELIDGGINNITTENINAAGLGTAAIADLAITTGKLADNSVTTAKLAAGITAFANYQTATPGNITISSPTTTETTLITFPAITTTGGKVLIYGAWSYIFNTVTSDILAGGAERTTNYGCEVTMTMRVKRDGTTIMRTGGKAGDFAQGVRIAGTPVNFDNMSMIPFPTATDAPSAGSHTYTITVQLAYDGTASNPGGGVTWALTCQFLTNDTTNRGTAFVVETFTVTTTSTSTSTSTSSTTSTSTSSTTSTT